MIQWIKQCFRKKEPLVTTILFVFNKNQEDNPICKVYSFEGSLTQNLVEEVIKRLDRKKKSKSTLKRIIKSIGMDCEEIDTLKYKDVLYIEKYWDMEIKLNHN